MSHRQSVAIVSFSPIHSDSRVLRQILSLSLSFNLYSIGFGPSPRHVVQHLQIDPTHGPHTKLMGLFLLLFRYFRLFYFIWFDAQKILAFIAKHNVKAVVLNDVTSWPLAAFLPSGVAVLDAHEYSPEELSDNLIWSYTLSPFKIWCSNFARYGAHRFSVEPYLCELWAGFTGCQFSLLPNSSPYSPPPKWVKNCSSGLRVLHHGVAHPSRRIELMIKAVSMAGSDFTSTFLLTGSNKSYLNYLKKIAVNSQCRILPPIPQDELIAFGSSYDIALLSIYPSNVNYANCLPNKLYQFIQSRLPIICGPTPAIASIVRRYDIGVVAADFTPQALANALTSLNRHRLRQMRANLDIAAGELCWDKDQHILLDSVHFVVSRKS
jgi:glycosyltransferase involved in cell wall biosynthesis